MSRKTRYFLVLLALMGLLLVTTTLGCIWHHHDSNTERNCPICHVSHQPSERPLAGNRLPVLVPISLSADASEPAVELAPDSLRIPARAPPTA